MFFSPQSLLYVFQPHSLLYVVFGEVKIHLIHNVNLKRCQWTAPRVELMEKKKEKSVKTSLLRLTVKGVEPCERNEEFFSPFLPCVTISLSVTLSPTETKF